MRPGPHSGQLKNSRMRMHNPPHPGEVLKAFLVGIAVAEVARKLGVSRNALTAVLNGRGRVTAEMALRLSVALNTSADLWLGMQTEYDLWSALKHPPTGVRPIRIPITE